jgi:hypothetical protein
MRYAAGLADGSVVIIDVAPKTVTVDGNAYRVTHFERVGNGIYRLSYFNVEENVPYTEEYAADDPAITYHSPQKELSKLDRSATNVQPIEDETFLEDRTFREAWKLVGSELTVDMPRAREIHRQHMRVARQPKLAQLDVDYFKTLEASVTTGLAPETPEYTSLENIAAQKQKLRDVTAMPEIEAAQTPEELKAVWPPELI